jgi:hypothetical protein
MSAATVLEITSFEQQTDDLDALVEQIVGTFPPLCGAQKRALAKLLSPASR